MTAAAAMICAALAAALAAALVVPTAPRSPRSPRRTAADEAEPATPGSTTVTKSAGRSGRGLRAARAERRRAAAAAADLPHVVGLLGDALRAGAPPSLALAQVTAALPGPAAERLEPVVARLRVGMEPAAVWSALRDDPALAPLGRAMARAAQTGASVQESVDGLAVMLAEQARQEAESRARAVGVRAAIPLGLCLLPAFVLLGIAPVVAVLLTDLAG